MDIDEALDLLSAAIMEFAEQANEAIEQIAALFETAEKNEPAVLNISPAVRRKHKAIQQTRYTKRPQIKKWWVNHRARDKLPGFEM